MVTAMPISTIFEGKTGPEIAEYASERLCPMVKKLTAKMTFFKSRNENPQKVANRNIM
jgi:hypothetical protein